MRQMQQAARRKHDVVIQLPAQVVPQLQCVLIQAGGLVVQIIRAHDGGIAAGVAAAQPAFFEHGDVGDAAFFGQIIRGRQPVAAAADNHDPIGFFGRRAAPVALPVLVVAQPVAQQTENRVFLHRCRCCDRFGAAIDRVRQAADYINIRAGSTSVGAAEGLKFNPLNRLDAGVERMFALDHFGHRIGRVDHLRRGAASGEQQMQPGGFALTNEIGNLPGR